MAYERELQVALDAAREAAGLCRTVQAAITPDVLQKKDKSPVTVADYGSQALVCRRLAEAFPNDAVIAEEDSAALREPDHAELLQKVVTNVHTIRPEADAAAVCNWIDHNRTSVYTKRFWTLDPIDGTKGFIRKEQYAIALALIVEGRVTVAALACPNLPGPGGEIGAIFTAVRGGGAFTQPLRPGQSPRRIGVSHTANSSSARFCESVESGHSNHSEAAKIAENLGISAAPVRMDSQAKYGVVARGEADIYLRLPTMAGYVEKIWDHAAGALVITEAGGTVTDASGKALDFSRGPTLSENRGVIVSNGGLHGAVLDALRRAAVV